MTPLPLPPSPPPPGSQAQAEASSSGPLQGSAAGSARSHFIDWLRVVLTAGVLTHHVMYILADGMWPMYGPWLPADDATGTLSFIFLTFNQAYFMGLFFFLAGLFTTPSFERKGAAKYLQDRAVRLLIPLAVYELLIAPLNCAIAQGVTSPQYPPGLAAAPSALVWYFRQYSGIGKNPLWFASTLFMFELAYVGFRAALRAASPGADARLFRLAMTPSEALKQPYSTQRTAAMMAAIAGAIATVHFLVRIVGYVTLWLPFPIYQAAYFGQYCIAYALGNAAFLTQVGVPSPLSLSHRAGKQADA